MLKITAKKYEIEEPIEVADENENVLYSFTMQVTAEELEKINNIIVNREDIKKADKYNKLLKDGNEEEVAKLEEEMQKTFEERQEEFENIVYKEHREEFKKAVGNYRYDEMTGMIVDFFWNAFIGKKMKQVNTIITDLAKISSK